MSPKPRYSFLDRLCLSADQVIRTLANNPQTTGAAYPGKNIPEPPLTDAQRKHVAALMRVNHAGEICAQALYHGQGAGSRSAAVQAKMQQAATEEGDHLAWCRQRIEELGSHTSYLDPLWYTGSFCIGLLAGCIGDKWSLGFVVETERQVIKHLEGHLQTLPAEDLRSYAVLKQMEHDESKHRDTALTAGAHELPEFIKKLMSLTAKVMVKTAYWL